MFLVAANTRQAIVGQKEWLTTGSSGIQVQFLFSEDWNGLSKFAVFRNAEIEESVIPIALPSSNLTELPAENCAAEYVDEKVYVGVYGTDGLGHIIIPTIWVSLGVLKEGAAYEGMDPPQPTPNMWAQILAIAQNAGAENAEAAEKAEAGAKEAASTAQAAAAEVKNLSVDADTLAAGEPATVEKTVDAGTGAVKLKFGIPQGPKGDPLTYEDLTEEQKAELVQGPIREAQTSAVAAVGSARTTAVNAVNQAGTTQTGAVNQAGANQVAAVNQAGETQAQAVEDKGAEVLDSIPPDYSDLAAEVDDLNRQINDVDFANEVQFPRSYFIRKSGLSDAGASTNNDARATSLGTFDVFDGNRIKIVSDDSNIDFIIYDTINSKWVGSYTSELIANEINGFRLVLRTRDGSEITGSAVDNLHIYTNYQGKQAFDKYFIHEFTYSSRFENYGETYVARYLLDTSEGNVGMLLRNNTSKRATYKWLVCNVSDCVVWCGQFSKSTLTIVIDNAVVAVLDRGASYVIPKGTKFICGFYTSSTDILNSLSNTCFCIVPNSSPMDSGTQLVSGTPLNGQDSCFIIKDKIFSIGREDTGYSVKQGDSWIVSKAPLEQNVGHANSCNYDIESGNAYISDWTDPSKIYCFSVDYDNNSMTYIKTLTIPIPEGRGSTEYYVFDNENQIYFLGWETGNSGTDPNVLMYGLYILTSEGYVLSWEKKAKRANTVQAMTVQDQYIYYLVVDQQNNFHSIGINRINMITGLTEEQPFAGTILTYEAEGIAPIGKQAFVIITRNGYSFLYLFADSKNYSNY